MTKGKNPHWGSSLDEFLEAEGTRADVDAIVQRHAGPIDLTAVTERPSAQGNFLGITYVISATSREQIAQLFAALKLCPQVMLVL